MKVEHDGFTLELEDQLLSGLAEMLSRAEGVGYRRGYADARRFDGVIDPRRDVFIIPAHSSLGNWSVESCAWSSNGPDFYIESRADHVAYFQTREEAVAAAVAHGYRVSELEPHAPGMRREHIRPPYAW